MATDPSAALKNTTNAIEASYQAGRQAAASIALLLARGAATCEDVRGYNLLALGIYNTQQAMLDQLVVAGVDLGGATTPPTPTLFYWNGTSGHDAALIDCSAPGMSGPLTGGTLLAPGSVRVVTHDPEWQNPRPNLTAAQIAAGELGEIPVLLVIVIIGLLVSITYDIVQIVSHAIEANAVTEQVAVQVQTKSEAAAKMYAARAGYIASCTGNANDCAANAVKLFPVPDLSVSFKTSSKWGVLSWIGLAAVCSLGGALLYRKYKRDGHILPEGRHHGGGRYELPEPDIEDAELVG
jgi:hypothetical protein